MSFDFSTLITDRAQSDLSALKALLAKPCGQWTEAEKTQFASAVSKGAYNYTDLNRVTAAMTYLDEVLKGYGYQTGFVPIKVHEEPEPEKPLLPDGYTQVDYIKSTGTQYIKTNIPVKSTSGFLIDFSVDSSSGQTGIVGGFTYGGYNNNFAAYSGQWMAQYGNNQSYTFGTVDTEKHTVEQNVTSGQLKFDGEVLQQNLPFYDNLERTFNLFCYNGGDTYPNFWIGASKISKAVFYESGQIVANFIPCINESGEVGFYDSVNNQFYGNAGTGVFIAGTEVVPEPQPSPIDPLDPYTWYESDDPTVTQLIQYLNNVVNLCEVLSLEPDLPEQMINLSVNGANQIEEALYTLWQTIQQVVNGFARSNCFTFWSGNRPFPCAESLKGRTWAELDAMETTWANWQVATWYLLLYGNLQAEGVVE